MNIINILIYEYKYINIHIDFDKKIYLYYKPNYDHYYKLIYYLNIIHFEILYYYYEDNSYF